MSSLYALYEVPATIESVLDSISEDGGEIKVHHRVVLDALREDFDTAVDGICKSIRNSEGRIAMLKMEMARLKNSIDAEQTRVDSSMKVLADGMAKMEDRGQGKKYGALFKVKMQDNPPSSEIIEPDDVPADYYRYNVSITNVTEDQLAAFEKGFEKLFPKKLLPAPLFTDEKKYDKNAIIQYWKDHKKEEAPAGTSVQQKQRVVIS